jgi:hypothetical protein
MAQARRAPHAMRKVRRKTPFPIIDLRVKNREKKLGFIQKNKRSVIPRRIIIFHAKNPCF